MVALSLFEVKEGGGGPLFINQRRTLYIHTYFFNMYIHIQSYTYTIYTDSCSSTSPQPQKRSAPVSNGVTVSGRHALQSLVEDRCCFGTGSRTSTATWRWIFFVWRFMAWKHYDIWVDFEILLSIWCINTTFWLCMTTSWLFVVVFLMCLSILSRFLWLFPLVTLW